MIPFNFRYDKPATLYESVSLFQQLEEQKLDPLYFSGGTEIITFGRNNRVFTNAIIDLKRIPECRTLEVQDQKLIVGSALTLSELHDSRVFPLLGETGAGIADRTSRNKITLGGNVCSQLIYREAVLPLLLTDSEVRIAGPDGYRQAPINQVFDRTLQLGKGEFLVQAVTDLNYTRMPYASVKKRKVAAIEYPLVTVAAIKTESGIRFAFSGVCTYPFRSEAIESVLNRRELPLGSRIDQAMTLLPAPVISDIQGSAAYRMLVLKNTVEDILKALGGE